MKIKVLGLCRVSSREQVDGTSLANQEREIRAYAAMKNMDLTILVDAGVSGGIPLAKRPEGSRAVAIIKNGEAKAVIITKLDRGFRSASDCLNTVENWEKKGVALHILNLGGQSIDTSTPTGKFFITVMAGAAELERNMINERCNEGRRARKLEGKRIGEIPFGYTLGDNNRLVKDEREQRIIGICCDLKRQGRSLRQIAAELNTLGIPTKKNRTWDHVRVHQLLKRVA